MQKRIKYRHHDHMYVLLILKVKRMNKISRKKRIYIHNTFFATSLFKSFKNIFYKICLLPTVFWYKIFYKPTELFNIETLNCQRDHVRIAREFQRDMNIEWNIKLTASFKRIQIKTD